MGFYRVREPIEARRVDSYDPSAVDTASWCGGSFRSDGTILVYGGHIAHHGEWIVKYYSVIGKSFGVLSDDEFRCIYVEIDE